MVSMLLIPVCLVYNNNYQFIVFGLTLDKDIEGTATDSQLNIHVFEVSITLFSLCINLTIFAAN